MNNTVQSIEDANKEMHELPGVLPVRHHGNSDLQPGIHHPSSLHMSHSHSVAQHHQHHHQQQQQHQSLSSSQTSHQHRQQPNHPQSGMSHPRQEPISPHPHHPQASMSPHPHQQSSMQHLKHPSLSSSHGLELDLHKASSSAASSLHLHSQGVNTSESVADIASSSSSQRPHMCTTCLKGFRSKQQLVQHSLVHTNIRKYCCTYCDRSFKQLSHLQQHTRIHTVQKGTDKVEQHRSFRCQFCQRAFKQLIHLQQHTRLHTGEKPYACKYEDCDRAFAQMSNLQHHMRNHEEQVKKEVLRIYKCHICHRSYTNDSSLKAHAMKMHLHMKLPDDLNPEEQPVKKRRKKNKHLSSAPTMVPLGEGDSPSRRDGSDISSDDDHVVMGSRKEHHMPSTMGNIPRNLMESLNQYERTLAAGMNGDRVHISDSNHPGTSGGGSRDPSRQATSLGGLMGMAGMDPSLMASQPPEVVERVAAAAAAAVSNQLLHSGQALPHTTTTSSSFQPPHPQPAHSHLMDAHLRNQVGLPPLHDQFYSHAGTTLGMLGPHAHLLGPPPRSMADLATTYASHISSAPSMVTASHLSLPSAPHINSRPPSAMASPHHVSEALNFNH